MRNYQYGNTIIKANSFKEADQKAAKLKLENLVSNEMLNKLHELIRLAAKKGNQEIKLGDRTLVVNIKVNDEDQVIGIHFDVTNDDDDHFLCENQITDTLHFAEQEYGQVLDIYDYYLENLI